MNGFVQNIVAKWTKSKRIANVKRRDRRVRLALESLEERVLLNGSPSPDPVWNTPAEVRHLYGFDKVAPFTSGGTNSQIFPADGRGQTIAIVDAFDDPNIRTDLATFSAQFGLVQMDGANGDPLFSVIKHGSVQSAPKGNSSPTSGPFALETAIDVEWAHAIAPRANIILVEAPSSMTNDLNDAAMFASDLSGVSVVSISFGGGSPNPGMLGRRGVTFVGPAGDGSKFGFPMGGAEAVIVGGTVIEEDAAGNYGFEVAWTATGGGAFPDNTPLPSWQTQAAANVASHTTNGTPTTRMAPDLAFDAVNYAVVDSYDLDPDNAWVRAAGTSVGTPEIAAMIAIANEGRSVLLPGRGPLNAIDPTLPLLYSLPSTDFHDIQSGGNNQGNTAFAGYDMVTGLGTPRADLVIRDLVQSYHGYYSWLDTFTGQLTVFGNDSQGNGGGSDHITISTQKDSQGSTRLVVTDNGRTDSFRGFDVKSIQINTRSSSDTVDIVSTLSIVPITVNLSGISDTVNVKSPDNLLSEITSNITVIGQVYGQSTLNVYDQANSDLSSPMNYFLTGNSFTRQLAPTINFFGVNNGVNLYGGSGNTYLIGEMPAGPAHIPSGPGNTTITLNTTGAGSKPNTIKVIDELYTDPNNSSQVDFTLSGLSGLRVIGHATDKFLVDNTLASTLPSGVMANPQTLTVAGDPVNGGVVSVAYSYQTSNGAVSGWSGFTFYGPNSIEIDGGHAGETFQVGNGLNSLDWVPAGLAIVLKGQSGDKLVLNDRDQINPDKPAFTSSNPVFTIASATSVSRDNTLTYVYSGKTYSVTTHQVVSFSNISSLTIEGGTAFPTTYNLSNLNALLPSMRIVGGGRDVVNVNDQQATKPRTYTIGTVLVPGSIGWADQGTTAPPPQLTYTGLAQMNFDGGNVKQMYNVYGTGANMITRLQAHGSSNSFNVGLGNLDYIKGTLDMHGAASASNSLTVADYNATAAQTYVLTTGLLQRADTIGHRDMGLVYFDTAFQTVVLNAPAQKGTAINVLSTGATAFTQIVARQYDSVIVGQLVNPADASKGHTLTGIQGVLNIQSFSSSTVQALLDDSGDSAARSNVLFDNDGNGYGVSGLAPAKIYLSLNASSPVTVRGSAGGDVFKIKNLPPFPLTINGSSAATNVLDYSAYVGDVIVDLPLGSATGLKAISGIENIVGSQGNDLIVGNSSTTSIIGGTGRNVLIGGGGTVNLDASRSGGDNILIGGTTSYDQQINALDAIFAEWTRTDLAFADRMSDLQFGYNHASGGTGGSVGATPLNKVNGALVLLNSSTVTAGSASATMTGGAGQNWYFLALNDDQDITNFKSGDQKTYI